MVIINNFMEKSEYARMEAVEAGHWWFRAKRAYVTQVLRWYGPRAGASVLDVGCGTGAVMQLAQTLGYRAHGIDMSPDALTYCKAKNLTVTLSTAEKINFPDASFEVVVALDVLEHVQDHAAAVREIARVLKPGGIFIATVPAHPELWSYHDVALHHVRRYRQAEFVAVLNSALRVEYCSWIHAVILGPAAVRRLFIKKAGAGGESDVQPASRLISGLFGVAYTIERVWWRVFKRLPFGLSLIAVARKP